MLSSAARHSPGPDNLRGARLARLATTSRPRAALWGRRRWHLDVCRAPRGYQPQQPQIHALPRPPGPVSLLGQPTRNKRCLRQR
ncbi:uncharacterized protein B0I36DRAFT_332281 [Microdochium trichocladiopsis]|uniref:Uncharacterized protein n=1 Tax=Microdochium trichocladiopsis TaxID=1682393 RepID=A0A9P8XY43_9PEZI|nr:uncharacterized protein B0I36DRAFT_332281 [Microdochium trichocladiopsis]KAH7024946.1 hypothetical protein B0I36DRAFT_332281 [Microdochium trichocladiopsis]